jgi:3-oxoacid CoA-transferase
MKTKEYIASRVAKELKNGDVINLGIGLPTLVTDFLPKDIQVFIHSENGILGVGSSPSPQQIDPDLVNAGKLPVTIQEGAAFFDSATSFAMIRGGHVDVAILGVLEVNQEGYIANWAIPGQTILGVGGAMDLLEGARKVIVATTHTAKDGKPKIVKETQYPLTSLRKADLIVTELAVFEVCGNKLILIELAPSVSLEEIKQKTEANFKIDEKLQ